MTEDDLEDIGMEHVYRTLEAEREKRREAKIHQLIAEWKRVDHLGRALRQETCAGGHWVSQDNKSIQRANAATLRRLQEKACFLRGHLDAVRHWKKMQMSAHA